MFDCPEELKSKPTMNDKNVQQQSTAAVRLKSSGHHQALVDGLWTLFTSQQGVDMSFQFSEQTFHLHQLIWDVFIPVGVISMSSGQVKGVMNFLLEFLYRGEVSVPQEQLKDLLDVGKQLNFEMLADAIESSKELYKKTGQAIQKRQRGRPKKSNTSIPKTDNNSVSHTIQRETRLSKRQAKSELGVSADGVLKKMKARRENGAVLQSTILVNAAKKEALGGRLTWAKSKSGSANMEQPDPASTVKANSNGGKERQLNTCAKKSLSPHFSTEKCGDVANCRSSDHIKEAEAGLPSPADAEEEGNATIGSPKPLPVERSPRKRRMIDVEPKPRSSRRKKWRLPTDIVDADMSDPAITSEEEAISVLETPIKTFKCGHCNFSSTVQEKVAVHIRALHLRNNPVGDAGGVAASVQVASPVADEAVHETNAAQTEMPSSEVESGIVSTDAPLLLPTLICPDCSFSTVSEDSYRIHLATHDPSVDYFKCTVCGRSYPCAETFKNHEIERHPESPATIKCPRCSIRRLQLGSYRSHLMLAHQVDHKGHHVSSLLCQCHQCDFTCAKVADMERHAKSHRRNGKPYRRSNDDERAAESLHRASDEEQQEAAHRCSHCTHSSRSKKEAVAHLQQVHPQPRVHVCETCGYSTPSANRLLDHSRTHTGERPYMCHVCAHSFAEESTLKRHLKERHEDSSTQRRFPCGNCGRTFRRNHTRAQHSRTCGMEAVPPKAGDKVSRRSACRHCPSAFPSQQAMIKHASLEHSGQHPLACDLCQFTCNDPSSLRKHVTIHTGEKNYKCRTCGRAFRDYATCKRHERCVHSCEWSDCPFCDRKFASRLYLKTHLKVVHKGKQEPAFEGIASEVSDKVCSKEADTITEVEETETSVDGVQVEVIPSDAEQPLELMPGEMYFLQVIEISAEGTETQFTQQ